MRQIYIKDIIKEISLIDGGILQLVDLKPQCPKCKAMLSFTVDPDNREILNVGDCICPEFVPSQGTIAERTKYKVTKDGIEVSTELHLKNGKANPFGWSQYEVWHNDKRIGWLNSGALELFDKDYIINE